MSKLSWRGPFHENATWLPSGDRLGTTSSPWYAVSGVAVSSAVLYGGRLGDALKSITDAAATTSADPSATANHLLARQRPDGRGSRHRHSRLRRRSVHGGNEHHISGKSIAVLGHGLDPLRRRRPVAERLAQRGDLEGEIGLLDEGVRPERCHQLLFGDRPTRTPYHQEQQLEGLRRKCDGLVLASDNPPIDVQTIRPERVHGVRLRGHGVLTHFSANATTRSRVPKDMLTRRRRPSAHGIGTTMGLGRRWVLVDEEHDFTPCA